MKHPICLATASLANSPTTTASSGASGVSAATAAGAGATVETTGPSGGGTGGAATKAGTADRPGGGISSRVGEWRGAGGGATFNAIPADAPSAVGQAELLEDEEESHEEDLQEDLVMPPREDNKGSEGSSAADDCAPATANAPSFGDGGASGIACALGTAGLGSAAMAYVWSETTVAMQELAGGVGNATAASAMHGEADEAATEAVAPPVVSLGPATTGGGNLPCLGTGVIPYFAGSCFAWQGVCTHTCTRQSFPSTIAHPVHPALRLAGFSGSNFQRTIKGTPSSPNNSNSSTRVCRFR